MLLAETKNPEFMNASMSSDWYKRFINLYVAGGNGAIGNLKKNDLLNQYVNIPSEKEQHLIGQLFSDLDKAITLHQRKLNTLIFSKKSLLEKLFPHPSKTTPELRFEGYEGEWSETTLGELSKANRVYMSRGEIISAKDMKANWGRYPVYSSSSINNGEMGTCNSYMFDEELITWSIDGGGDVFYRKPHRFSVTNVCGYLRCLEDVDCSFLAYQMQAIHKKYHFDYQTKAHPSVIKELYPIYLPSLEEQQLIGNLLTNLDDTIEAQQAKVSKLKQAKNALLERMFI